MNILIETLRVLKRRFFIRRYGLKGVAPTFIATSGCRIAKDLVAGEYSFVGRGSQIYPRVSIGRYTMLANNVSILGGDHFYKKAGTPIIFSGRDELRRTVIGDDVWVGAHTIIMTGVHIGNGAIVAAGSVVTKDIPPYSIYGGVPARLIKMRFTDQGEIDRHEAMLRQPATALPKEVRQILRGKHEYLKVVNSGGVKPLGFSSAALARCRRLMAERRAA